MPRIAVLAVGVVAVGCAAPRPPVGWAPLEPGAYAGGLTATLVPETELGLDIPRFGVAHRQLDSGLRVGVESSPARGQVAVVLAIGAGASDDPPEREGLAHLVEHLVYHARANGEAPLSDRLMRLGARFNADTSLDATRYYEVLPASALPALLAFTGDRLSRPLAGVDDADFERERAIVENELNQRNELGVVGLVVGWMQQALYPPGHPYSRPIGGTVASLRRLTLADARRFAATHYRTDNATLLVTGEIGGPTPLASVATMLPSAVTARGRDRPGSRGLVPAAAFAPGSVAEPRPGYDDAHDTLHASVAMPQIWLVWNLGGDNDADSAVNKVLVAPAAEAMVRDKLSGEPGVVGVAFHAIELRHATWLACEIDIKDTSRRTEIARNVRNLVWRLWSDTGPSTAANWGDRWMSVPSIHRIARTGAVLGAEPFLARALDRASAFQASGEVGAYDRMLARIGAVRPSDISSRARDLLAPARARMLYVEPAAAHDRRAPGAVGVRGAEGALVSGGRRRGTDFRTPPSLPSPAGLDRTSMVTLPNGLPVVLVPRPQFPSVTVLLGFHGGRAALPAGVLELVRAVEPRREGVGRTTALDIEAFDGPGWSADFINTDRRHLSNAMLLLTERLRAIADTEWASLLRLARMRTIATPDAPKDPRDVANVAVARALYLLHPFSREIDGDGILGVPPHLPEQWLPSLYNPQNAVLIIVGDIDPGNAANLAAGWFANWWSQPGTGRLMAPPVPPALNRAAGPGRDTVIVTHRPVTSQVEVGYFCRLPPVVDPRTQAAQRMLGGFLGAELTTLIREEAGAAYSVGARVVAAAGGAAHLEISMAVDSRRLRGALATLRGVLDATAAGRLDAGSLSQVRWSLTRQIGLRDLTSRDLALDMFRTMTLGFAPAVLGNEAAQIAATTGDDIARMFAPCAGHAVLSLLGDETIIRSAL
jgi:zinc protease